MDLHDGGTNASLCAFVDFGFLLPQKVQDIDHHRAVSRADFVDDEVRIRVIAIYVIIDNRSCDSTPKVRLESGSKAQTRRGYTSMRDIQ